MVPIISSYLITAIIFTMDTITTMMGCYDLDMVLLDYLDMDTILQIYDINSYYSSLVASYYDSFYKYYQHLSNKNLLQEYNNKINQLVHERDELKAEMDEQPPSDTLKFLQLIHFLETTLISAEQTVIFPYYICQGNDLRKYCLQHKNIPQARRLLQLLEPFETGKQTTQVYLQTDIYNDDDDLPIDYFITKSHMDDDDDDEPDETILFYQHDDYLSDADPEVYWDCFPLLRPDYYFGYVPKSDDPTVKDCRCDKRGYGQYVQGGYKTVPMTYLCRK